ncbi:MAG: hypothetical protein EGR84_00310, partial [Coprococcus catus]|nr:hypothetical protein [Coprococcus catus]
AQSESSKSVVNSVLISREMPVFPGFLEIIRVVIAKKKTSIRFRTKYDIMSVSEREQAMLVHRERRMAVMIAAYAASSTKGSNQDIIY